MLGTTQPVYVKVEGCFSENIKVKLKLVKDLWW